MFDWIIGYYNLAKFDKWNWPSQFVSAPQCLGIQLGRLAWLGWSKMLGNHKETSSLMGLVLDLKARLSWPCQLELLVMASSFGFGFSQCGSWVLERSKLKGSALKENCEENRQELHGFYWPSLRNPESSLLHILLITNMSQSLTQKEGTRLCLWWRSGEVTLYEST